MNTQDYDWEEVKNSKDISLKEKCKIGLNKLINSLPNGEIRPQQEELVESLCDIIENNNNGMLQAGTGVGKSIGYLLPAILSGKKVFVTTATKQLTSQLATKDLPLLKNILFPDLKFTELQSFTNFICPRKVVDKLTELGSSKLIDDELALKEKNNASYLIGRLDEYIKGEMRAEDFVTSNMSCDCENFTCAGSACTRRCKFADKENCPVYRLVRKSKDSQVIVTNHAFASVLVMKAKSKDDLGILKNREIWIADEAHDLDKYLENASSTKMNITDISDYIGKLRKYLEDKSDSSIQKSFIDKFNKYMVDVVDRNREDDYYMYQEQFDEELSSALTIIERLYKLLENLKFGVDDLIKEDEKAKKQVDASGVLEYILEFTDNEVKFISDSVETLAIIKNHLDTLDTLDIKYIPTIIKIINNVLESLKIFLRSVMFKEEYIVYERYTRLYDEITKGYIVGFEMCATYLNVGDALQSGMGTLDLDKSTLTSVNTYKMNLICVSATLSIDNTFEGMADKLGMNRLKDVECIYKDVGTVFDYNKQGLMYIPQNIPDVKKNREEQFEFFKQDVKRLIEISQGGALILCTTNKETYKTYEFLKNELGSKYNILSACDKEWHNKNKLVEAFRQDTNSVLIGTRGFFQGLDVQGSSLRLLCLNKIPYGNPDIVSRKKDELLYARGLDAYYYNATVPTTMILLQAIGRLIRHTSDKGVVAIYDNRLYSGSNWIQPVANSIPPFRKTSSIEDVREFLEGEM